MSRAAVVVGFCLIGSPTWAQVSLVSDGVSGLELSLVHCNKEKQDAKLQLITAGTFAEPENDRMVAAGACKAFRLRTRESNVVVHAIAGSRIEVISYHHSRDPWLSRSAIIGIAFTLLGLFIASLQEVMKTIISGPANVLRTFLAYRENRNKLKLFADDAAKGFELSPEVVNIAQGKDAGGGWTPVRLRRRIMNLYNIHRDWKGESVTSDDTNERIKRL